jgi:hypothetical protein
MDNLSNEARMELALSDLSKQTDPNFLGTARRFKVHRTTLQRRFQGTQQSRRIAHSEAHQCLSIPLVVNIGNRGSPCRVA